MGSSDRHVERLHLRAGSEAEVRRTSVAMEDALRTASFRGERRDRLILVRELQLGRLKSGLPSQSLALALEGAFNRMLPGSVPGSSPAAAEAGAVWFESELQARILLALRLLSGPPPREWFWGAAVPAWNQEVSRSEALRVIAGDLADRPEGATSLKLWMQALIEAGHGSTLLRALGPELRHRLMERGGQGAGSLTDGGAMTGPWLAALGLNELGGLDGPDAGAGQTGPSASPAPSPPQRPARGSPPSALSSTQLPRPSGAASAPAPDPASPPQARSMDRPAPGGGETPAEPIPAGTGARWPASAPPRDSDGFPRWSSSRRRLRRPVFPGSLGVPGRTRSAPSIGRPLEEMVSVPSPGGWEGEAQGQGLPGPAPGLRPDLPTRAGGLLFLLNALARKGFPQWLRQRHDSLQRRQEFTLTLLMLALVRLGVGGEDPIWGALVPGAGRHQSAVWVRCRRLGGRPEVCRWLRRLRRELRQRHQIGLEELVLRHGRLHTTATHLEVGFDLDQVDLRIRMGGLDLDPGWLPWLGRVVSFRYGQDAGP